MRGARPMRSTRRLQNLTGSAPRWWSITNRADTGEPALVSIYDEIGFFGVSAGDFLAELAGVQGDIDLHVNSPGGDVFDAIAIYNTLKARKGTVSVTVDGLAASAASFIAQAASPGKLFMAPHATMMIHDGFAAGIGNAADMRELADQLDAASDNIAAIYADRSGKPAAYWRAKMKATTWYKDQEAVEDGLADAVVGKDSPKNSWDLTVYNASQTGTEELGDGWVRDPDGTVRFDPDGDGDDDSTPEGDTDHDYFDEHGTQIKEIPPCPRMDDRAPQRPRNVAWQFDLGDRVTPKPECARDAAHGVGTVDEVNGNAFGVRFDGADEVYRWYLDNELMLVEEQNQNANGGPPPMSARSSSRVRNEDVDSSPWDASKAWANGASSDDPAAFYKGICAGEKTTGDPATQAHWALPYRYTPDSAPNAAAVRNALARLDQTQGLKDPEGVRSKLEGLMKKVNPDYAPDNHIDSGLLSAVLADALKGGNS